MPQRRQWWRAHACGEVRYGKGVGGYGQACHAPNARARYPKGSALVTTCHGYMCTDYACCACEWKVDSQVKCAPQHAHEGGAWLGFGFGFGFGLGSGLGLGAG